MSIFRSIKNKFRDSLYSIVEREGGFGLQFFADLVRGTHTKQKSTRTQSDKAHKSEVLIYEERIVFQEMCQRKPKEGQIDYWKRKKAIMNHADKKSLIAEEMLQRQRNNKTKDIEQKIAAEKEKRIKQAQMRTIKHTKTIGRQR